MTQFLSGLFCLALALPAAAQSPARQGRDYAVFFAVADFQKPGLPALPETIPEAEAILAELRDRFGFQTELLRNPTRQEILEKIATYNRLTYGPNDQLVFFFSTHGYYDALGDEGFLIPADGQDEDRYGTTWISYDELGRYVNRNPCRHVLLSLDACHSGSFGIRNKGEPTGKAYEQGEDCTARIRHALQRQTRRYVCSGSKEKRTPARSLFARSWLEALRTGGQDGVLYLRDLEYFLAKIEIPAPESGAFSNHEEGGDFVFVRRSACGELPPGATDGESALWQNAQRQNTLEALNHYLDLYPAGRYRTEALGAREVLAEDQAWTLASRHRTPAAYRMYLDIYPEGRYAPDASQALGLSAKTGNPAAGKPDTAAVDRSDPFVLVRGGTFQMGSTTIGSNEMPVHPVTLSDFYISRYEMTVAEYLAFCDETNSHYPEWLEKGNENHLETGANAGYYKDLGYSRQASQLPIVGISWDDATAYCQWLSRKTGKNYRLPTEAEWEFAARGGTQSRGTKYAGSEELYEVAWDEGNSGGHPHPVGGKKANELGLFDMSGNVLEFCSDWDGPYPDVAQTNPQGPESGRDRVMRGGSWSYGGTCCRVAYHLSIKPYYRVKNVGFRVVRSP